MNNTIKSITDAIIKQNSEWREAYIKVYAMHLGLTIEEIELVETHSYSPNTIQIRYTVRKKDA